MSRLLTVLLVFLSGCLEVPGSVEDFSSSTPKELTDEAILCGLDSLDEDTFCMPGETFERWLREGELSILDGKVTSSGASGAMKVLVELKHPDAPEDLVFHMKWKPAAGAWNGLNNSPRKEIAAYQLQKMYLDQQDWPVPPTVMRCLPIQPGHTVEKRAGEKDIDCAWGLASYWLSHIDTPGMVDWERVDNDEEYKRAITTLNLYMYLIGHRDAHYYNWLLTTGNGPLRGISIDNGISFSGFNNFTKKKEDWKGLMSPAYPKNVVDRLREVSDADLAELHVVGRWNVVGRDFQRDGDGGLELPARKPWFYRRKQGLYMHGLRQGELRTIRRKIRKLLRKVDSGKIPTF